MDEQSLSVPALKELAFQAVTNDVTGCNQTIHNETLVPSLPFFQHVLKNSNSEVARECAAAVMLNVASAKERSTLVGTACHQALIEQLLGIRITRGGNWTNNCSCVCSKARCVCSCCSRAAVHSLVTEDDTRPAAAEAGAVPAVLLAFSSTLNAAAHITSVIYRARKLTNEYFNYKENNHRTQEALAATLQSLAKDAAIRPAVVAAGGASQLLAALRSGGLRWRTEAKVEVALLELASDAATAEALVRADAVPYFMKQHTDFLQESVQLLEELKRWPPWLDGERYGLWDPQPETFDTPAPLSANVVQLLTATPAGRSALCAKPNLTVMKKLVELGRVPQGLGSVVISRISLWLCSG